MLKENERIGMALDDKCLDDILNKAVEYTVQEEADAVALELLSIYLEYRDQHGYALFLYGDCLRKVGRQSEALRILRRAVKYTPPKYKYEVYVRLGLLRQIQSPKSAEKWFEKATTTAPNNVGWIFVLRAGNLMRLELFNDAIKCLKTAINKGDVEYGEAYLNLGICYRALRRYDFAENSFQKALEYDQSSAEIAEIKIHLDAIKMIENEVKYLAKYKGKVKS